MKLIIEIDEKIYRAVIEDNDMEIVGDNTIELGKAIANGIPHEERPQGEWIPCKDDNFCKCSECKQIVMSEERSNFCPNCGASMRKEGECNG